MEYNVLIFKYNEIFKDINVLRVGGRMIIIFKNILFKFDITHTFKLRYNNVCINDIPLNNNS